MTTMAELTLNEQCLVRVLATMLVDHEAEIVSILGALEETARANAR